MILSGLGLVAVVVFDLRQAVRESDARAIEVAGRDAERGARELRSALSTASVLERIPPERRFSMSQGTLVIPELLGSLEPEVGFDAAKGMDPVAQDRLRRAERAHGDEALELWTALRGDPTLQTAAKSWVTARVAWFAEREGDAALRDVLLAELLEGAPAEVGASVLLLCARAAIAAPDWARAALPRLSAARGEAILERLEEQGVDVAEDRGRCEQAREQRAALRTVRELEPLLAAATRPELRATKGALLLYSPGASEGALLTFDGLTALVASLERSGLDGGPALALGGRLSAESGEADVIEGFASVEPKLVLTAGLTSGSTGLALLSLALAALCGGGALLALRGARREAQAAQLRAEFLTSVTHELKTPLTGIRLTADLLLDGHVSGEDAQRKHMGRLAGEALRLGVLIDNVLDLGRIERGERSHRPVRADLVELVAETVALFEPLAARAGLELVFDAPSIPIQALVDRDALRQCLLNVLDNARKYGGEGGRIVVTLAQDAESVRLRVRDFGPGVIAEERETVFERFRRGGKQLDGSVPGVGLGLYLARELMRRHAGELSCVDVADGGAGACFELSLPFELKLPREKDMDTRGVQT